MVSIQPLLSSSLRRPLKTALSPNVIPHIIHKNYVQVHNTEQSRIRMYTFLSIRIHHYIAFSVSLIVLFQ